MSDVELRNSRPIESRRGLVMKQPEPRKLSRTNSHGIALKQEPDAALASQQAEHLTNELVYTRQSPERLERGPVSRVLPAYRRDLGKRLAWPVCWKGGAHVLLSLSARSRSA